MSASSSAPAHAFGWWRGFASILLSVLGVSVLALYLLLIVGCLLLMWLNF